VSVAHVTTVASGCHFQSTPSCGYPAPSIEDFFFKPIFKIGGFEFTKPILIMVLSVAIVLVVFWLAFRKPKLVPRGIQNVGELGVLAVRDQILRPQMGSKGDRYLPFRCRCSSSSG
jgi:F-type H+-transporting ATPase subunit a